MDAPNANSGTAPDKPGTSVERKNAAAKRRHSMPSKTENLSERVSSRRSKCTSCGVSDCKNTESSVSADGRPIAFFDVPKDNKLRQQWFHAVPEVTFLLPMHRKICQDHFEEGRPSISCPVPKLNLTGSPQKAYKPRKSKSGANEKSVVDTVEQVAENKPSPNPIVAKKNLNELEKQPFEVEPEPDLPQKYEIKPAQPVVTTSSVIQPLINKPKNVTVLRPDANTPISIAVIKRSPATNRLTPSLQGIQIRRESGASASGSAVTPVSGISTRPMTSTSRQLSTLPGSFNMQTPATRPPWQREREKQLCQKCSVELPQLKRNLGRMESRLDSMISMVRTVFVQQYGQPISNNQVEKMMRESKQQTLQATRNLQTTSALSQSLAKPVPKILPETYPLAAKISPESAPVPQKRSVTQNPTVIQASKLPTILVRKVAPPKPSKPTAEVENGSSESSSRPSSNESTGEKPTISPPQKQIRISGLSIMRGELQTKRIINQGSPMPQRTVMLKRIAPKLPDIISAKRVKIEEQPAGKTTEDKTEKRVKQENETSQKETQMSAEPAQQDDKNEQKQTERQSPKCVQKLNESGPGIAQKKIGSENKTELKTRENRREEKLHDPAVTQPRKSDPQTKIIRNIQPTKPIEKAVEPPNAAKKTENSTRVTSEPNAANGQGVNCADTEPIASENKVQNGQMPFVPPAKPKYYLTNAIVRSILTFTGKGFAVSHLRELGPLWMKNVPKDKLDEILNCLVDSELLVRAGTFESEEGADRELYLKVPGPVVLRTERLQKLLSHYGVAAETYYDTFKWAKSNPYATALERALFPHNKKFDYLK